MNGAQRWSQSHTRRGKATALLSTAAAIALMLGFVVAGTDVTPASAALPTSSTPQPEPLTNADVSATGRGSPAEPVKITLITGDSVLYADSDGAMPSIDVELDPDSGTRDVSVLTGPDGVYVIPDQAQPLIDADVVDRRLFDVQYLAENGYTDDEVDALPVIVTYENEPMGSRSSANDGASLSARAAALPSTETEPRELESIHGAAIQVGKESADDFWTHISGADPSSPAETMTFGPDSTELRDGIGKVWLDGKVAASLDDSRPQIGVPEAWDHGFDGAGATVAVLDSGYDPDHPDLAGQVSGSMSFVPGEESAHDRDGHGTHVASTIAGTGAGSDGRYAGVAPGADLIVGKVLTGGFGLDSWIISGMEWAGENADVVNMSLGTFFPTDGTDPISLALNEISADTGALFVVAAGNSGPSRSSVSSPASADAALAVAAVDSEDQVAHFSSVGPRRGDLALKPEIAAPGNPVVAAWATGTNPSPGVPVGEYYVAHAGTSMASPHVAGVAAMLVQNHPDWDAQQLKDALMSTSFDAGNGIYAQGTGRVDAGRATTQTLFATGKADFGLVSQDQTTRARTITYTNTGDADLTVDLTLDVDRSDPLPHDALTLSTDSVVVPAGGEATVDVVLDPSLSQDGEFTGHVLADTADARAATAVAVIVQGPTHDLTVTAKSRFGDIPYSGLVILHDLNNANRYYTTSGFDGSGNAVFDVPAGDYALQGNVRTRDRGRSNVLYSTDVYATTAMDVDGDRTVTIDARSASDIEFDVVGEQRATEPMQITQNIYRTDAKGQTTGLAGLGQRQDTNARFGAIPSEEPPLGDVYMTTMTTLREPLIQASLGGRPRSDLFAVTPERTGRFDGTRELELVDVGSGTAEDFDAADVEGKLVMAETADYYVAAEAARAAEHGAAALLVIPQAPGVTSVAVASDNELPVIATSHAEGPRLREHLAEGPVSVTLTGVRESSFTYTLRGVEDGAISADLTYIFDRSDLAVVKNSFHSEADRLGSDGLSAFEAWEGGALSYLLFLQQPTDRTDYVVAGTDIRQRHSVSSKWGANSARLTGADTAYRPGQLVRVNWFKAPNHPSSYSELACIFCRSEAILQFAPRRYGDSDPTHYGNGRVGTSYTVYRDGELVDRPELLLVPEAATYRIEQVAQATPDDDHFLANRSQTAWTFHSEAPSELEIDGCRDVLPGANACAALPVILLGYDLPLSIENTAPANRPFKFDVRADRPNGYAGFAEVAGMKVSLSFDDGASWQRAQTIPMPRGEGFRVLAQHPKLSDTNGYVSLRVEAWDDDGNRTSQTIERAYALSPNP